jgi:hypothetical protein
MRLAWITHEQSTAAAEKIDSAALGLVLKAIEYLPMHPAFHSLCPPGDHRLLSVS